MVDKRYINSIERKMYLINKDKLESKRSEKKSVCYSPADRLEEALN